MATATAATATATTSKRAAAATRKRTSKAKAFDVTTWKADLIEASKAEASAATRVLELIKSARGKIDEATAREAVKDAFGPAGANWKDKTLQKRVSDAMAIFKAAKLPKDMPANLQRAADACRKANPGKPRKPRAGTDAPKAGTVEVKPSEATSVETLKAALTAQFNKLKAEVTDPAALMLIGDLLDTIEQA